MQKSAHAFGAALRLLRTRRRLKQWELAEKAGMTKAMLSSYETGKVTPTLQSLILLFEALETDFFGFQDALEAADHADRLLFEERPSPRALAAAGEDQQARPDDQENRSQPLGALEPWLDGIESQLERIATCLESLLRRTLGEAPGRAVPQDSDQR